MTAMGRRGAHAADLRPASEVQPLARHRDELAVAANADVVAKLDGSVQGCRDALRRLRTRAFNSRHKSLFGLVFELSGIGSSKEAARPMAALMTLGARMASAEPS